VVLSTRRSVREADDAHFPLLSPQAQPSAALPRHPKVEFTVGQNSRCAPLNQT